MALLLMAFGVSGKANAAQAPLPEHLKPKAAPALDLLILGGRLVDGTGGDPFVADIGVHGNKIVFIGDAEKAGLASQKVIGATGLLVTPGFIDPHTHTLSDLANPEKRSLLNYLHQGVTTVVTGNDGGGPMAIAERFATWRETGMGVNVGLLTGHGTIRRQVMGMSPRKPSEDELQQMQALVGQAMDEGALGLSTGLYYAPGSYADTEEVIALARVAAQKGGIYDSHIRDESDYTIGLIGAIDEAIRIGREASIPVNISHIKALGPAVWHQSGPVIEKIIAARNQGLRVTADQYPYLASGTSIRGALIPRWALAGGRDSLLVRLKNEDVRQRLVADMRENLFRRGGASSLLIISARQQEWVGQTLADIAATRIQDEVETAIQLEEAGGAGLASFNMNEADVLNLMQQDFVMTGSDGSTGHPRKYGSFPRKIREYVYDKKAISLPFAIRSSSALAAHAFGLTRRGLLRKGYFADIAVIAANEFRDGATFEDPRILASGVRYVVLNGQIVIDNGVYTGVMAGQALIRGAGAKR